MKQANEEILDLVNEKDEVIGEVEKNKANSDPKLIHREIGVYIYDSQKRALFNKRSLSKKIKPGWWTVIGGHVSKGEDPEMAAHRELFEEMGFDTKLLFLEKVLKKDTNETHFGYLFVGHYDGQQINFNHEEMDEVNFLDEKDVENAIANGEKFGHDSVAIAKKIWEGKMEV